MYMVPASLNAHKIWLLATGNGGRVSADTATDYYTERRGGPYPASCRFCGAALLFGRVPHATLTQQAPSCTPLRSRRCPQSMQFVYFARSLLDAIES